MLSEGGGGATLSNRQKVIWVPTERFVVIRLPA